MIGMIETCAIIFCSAVARLKSSMVLGAREPQPALASLPFRERFNWFRIRNSFLKAAFGNIRTAVGLESRKVEKIDD